MAKVKQSPPTKEVSEHVEAVCLLSCVFGNVGEVISLSAIDAEIGRNSGMLDLHPDAIKANRVIA